MEKDIERELIFYGEDYFFEYYGKSASDKYLFVGKSYILDNYHGEYYWVRNLQPNVNWSVKFSDFIVYKDMINKLFCTKIEYRKHKLKRLNDYVNLGSNG
jgi:hypothetical protein